MKSQRNLTIDVYRIIAAALILLIHTSMVNMNGKIYYNKYYYYLAITIGRYCVPIFMVISGYFYFLNPTYQHKIKVLKNLFLLWIIWMIIYMPIGLYKFIKLPYSEVLNEILKFFFQSSLNFGGSWYLVATFWGIIIVDLFRQKNQMKVLNVITVILFILENINSTYYYLCRPFSYFAKPGEFCLMFFTGIVWINVSFYIVKYKKTLLKFGTCKYLVGAVLLTSLEFALLNLAVPNYLLNSYNGATESFITLPLGVICTFLYLLNHPIKVNYNHAIIFRNLATLMYFTQFGIIDISLHIIHFEKSFSLLYWQDLLIVVLVSCVIITFSKIKYFSMLKVLYDPSILKF
ncbi:MAG: acyltransferase family protein [Limosilactobacillus sp.]